MEIYPLFLDDIRVPDNHRALNEEAVAGLVSSFKEIGQQIPITYYDDEDGAVLIAGLHRLEAARRLDWDTIDAVEMDVDPLTRELWKIDENLIRAELTEIERTNHLKRRKEIFKARKASGAICPTSLSDGRKAGPQHQKGFAQDAADKTGISKRDINRSIRRGEKIVPEVLEAIKDMPAADKGVELDAIAELEPDEQLEAVGRVKSGASKDFREAKDAIKGNVTSIADIEYERLQKAWRRAGGEARERFLTWINQDYEDSEVAGQVTGQ